MLYPQVKEDETVPAQEPREVPMSPKSDLGAMIVNDTVSIFTRFLVPNLHSPSLLGRVS